MNYKGEEALAINLRYTSLAHSHWTVKEMRLEMEGGTPFEDMHK